MISDPTGLPRDMEKRLSYPRPTVFQRIVDWAVVGGAVALFLIAAGVFSGIAVWMIALGLWLVGFKIF